MIENETKLINALKNESNFAFVDTLDIKDEAFTSELIIMDVHNGPEAISEDENESSNFEDFQEEKPKAKRKRKPKKLEKGKPDDEYDKLPTNADGKVICPHCSKPFLRMYIHQHIERIHLALKDYFCDKCGRNFYKRSSIESHMNQHINIQPFKCPKKNCDKKFFNRTSVRTHIIKSHTKEANFICEICASSFKEKYMLKVI